MNDAENSTGIDLESDEAEVVDKTIMHTVRTASGGRKALKLTRGLAIKLACTECMGFEEKPSDCTAKLCPLFPYRGKTLKTNC